MTREQRRAAIHLARIVEERDEWYAHCAENDRGAELDKKVKDAIANVLRLFGGKMNEEV